MTQKKDLSRPPVVTVLGHVDHGKSTLIEALRHINITAKEHGGITQHIGAYQITHQGRPITIIDTPGHAAFANMRSRGAKVTDLVVLLVAADDGIKPQTKESLDHIRAAQVPFLVAINKIDLPNASPGKVKKQLAEAGVYVEGFGGDIVCVEISAKTKKNLKLLLDMILLLSDMQELKSNPQAPLKAVVIESKLDQKAGPQATLLIKAGTLNLSDPIWADSISGKVKAMFNDQGQRITFATPSQPVVVLGFKSPPPVGATVTASPPKASVSPSSSATSLSPVEDSKDAAKKTELKLKIILKTDVQGTLEAILSNLSDHLEVISSGTGAVTESDVLLASTTQSQILAFNVPVSKSAQRLAEIDQIKIKTYTIIYQLLEDVEKQVLKLIEPTIDEQELGQAQIMAEFPINDQRIAGCEVKSGRLKLNDTIHLKRADSIIADAKIVSLQQGKNQVLEVKSGANCGLALKPQLDFKINDMILSYRKISANKHKPAFAKEP